MALFLYFITIHTDILQCQHETALTSHFIFDFIFSLSRDLCLFLQTKTKPRGRIDFKCIGFIGDVCGKAISDKK